MRVFVCSVHSGCFFIKLLIDTPGRNATGCFETDMHAIWIWEEIRNYVQFFFEETPAVARFSKSVALNICRGLEVWKLLIRWHQATGSMSTSGMENLRDVDDSGASVYCCVFARGADQHLRQSIGCGKWQVVMCSKFFQLCTACMFCIILCIVTTQAFHTQKIRVDLWVIIYVWVSSKPSRVPNMLTDLLKSETIRFQNST